MVDTFLDEVLAHHGIKGQKWGIRRHRDDSGPKPKKLSRQEVKAEKQAFYQAKSKHVLDVALKEPQSLIYLRTQYGDQIVTGREFVQHMSNGGLMNPKYTDVYAQQHGGKDSPYVLNANLNARYRRSDKKH